MDRHLHVFRDPPLDGPTNMARNEGLLYSEQARPAAVRVSGWAPASGRSLRRGTMRNRRARVLFAAQFPDGATR